MRTNRSGLADRLTEDGPALVCGSLPRIGQVDLMMAVLVGDVSRIAHFGGVRIHPGQCRGLIVIRADMHALEAQPLMAGEELHDGEVRLLLGRGFRDRPREVSRGMTKSGRRIMDTRRKRSLCAKSRGIPSADWDRPDTAQRCSSWAVCPPEQAGSSTGRRPCIPSCRQRACSSAFAATSDPSSTPANALAPAMASAVWKDARSASSRTEYIPA